MPYSDIFSLTSHPYSAGGSFHDDIQVNGTIFNITGATATCGFDYQGHFYLANNDSRYQTGIEPLGYIPHQQIICQPSNGYQWGFSYQIMLLVVILHTFWSLGLYAVWIDSQKHSSLVKRGHRLGRWKVILELADSLRKELGTNTSSSYSQAELDGMITRMRSVKYVTAGDDNVLLPEGDTISLQTL